MAGDRPTLSIVIPVLNATRDLRGCLQRVRRQSMPPDRYEILAVDGGSSDGTQELALDAGARVVHNPYRRADPGVSVGISEARAEIVMVLAADNWIAGTNFLDLMIAPFGDPTVRAAFPRVISTAADRLPNRYINRYSDPFSHFVYGSSRSSIDVMLAKEGASSPYVVIPATVMKHPLLALAQGATIRPDRSRLQSPNSADDVLTIVEMIAAGGRIALVPGAHLEHHHVDGLRSFYAKYRGRARASLQGEQGYLRRRNYLSPARRLRTLLWPLYSASLVLPLVHGIGMSLRRRDPLLLYHPVLNTVLLAAVVRELLARRRVGGATQPPS